MATRTFGRRGAALVTATVFAGATGAACFAGVFFAAPDCFVAGCFAAGFGAALERAGALAVPRGFAAAIAVFAAGFVTVVFAAAAFFATAVPAAARFASALTASGCFRAPAPGLPGDAAALAFLGAVAGGAAAFLVDPPRPGLVLAMGDILVKRLG